MTEGLNKDLKGQIEAAVKEQIEPLFKERSIVEKWHRLLLSMDSADRIVKRLFSGQPSELLKSLCENPDLKKSKKNTAS